MTPSTTATSAPAAAQAREKVARSCRWESMKPSRLTEGSPVAARWWRPSRKSGGRVVVKGVGGGDEEERSRGRVVEVRLQLC